jgi:KEOPS complex subunit Pcc1
MGAFVHEATYTFAYESTATATLVERSVRPEIGDIEDDRSTVALTREEATLEVAVEAADLVALRAASNTWLTLVDVAESSAGCGQSTPNR